QSGNGTATDQTAVEPPGGRVGAPRTGQGSGPDRNAVRRRNLAAVVRALTDRPSTRARLAGELGLTRATVSSLVTELGQRGLVRTHEPDRHGAIGRPGNRVELVPGRVLGVGLEINVDHLAAVVLDLAGTPLARSRESRDVAALAPADALAAGVELAAAAVDRAQPAGTDVTTARPHVGCLDTSGSG